jgi:hypothetical protein
MTVKSISTLLLLWIAGLCSFPQATAQVNVAVVVNPANAATNVSLGDLRKIFSGEKRSWSGGQPIKLVVRGPGCLERLALLRLLAMSEGDYKQYWTAQVLRGEADAEPLTVPSIGMQMESLKVFPGAITLMTVQDVKPGMKVLKVDGLLPSAPGYPLH